MTNSIVKLSAITALLSSLAACGQEVTCNDESVQQTVIELFTTSPQGLALDSTYASFRGMNHLLDRNMPKENLITSTLENIRTVGNGTNSVSCKGTIYSTFHGLKQNMIGTADLAKGNLIDFDLSYTVTLLDEENSQGNNIYVEAEWNLP